MVKIFQEAKNKELELQDHYITTTKFLFLMKVLVR